MHSRSQGSIFAMICLVAGTCVGGGMLALPVSTSLAGFIPSLILMALVCVFMMVTGLLFVEANLWLGPGAHITSMSRSLLGPFGKVLSVCLYLFIGYLSMIAYTSGGGQLAAIILGGKKWLGALLFALAFSFVIFLGNKTVGRINALLMLALFGSYFLLLGGGLGKVDVSLLLHRDWTRGFYALPLILTTFSYQAVVPSLVLYVNGDVRRLKIGIIGGTVLAFFIYTLWQMLVLGVIPLEGPHGLKEAYFNGESSIEGFRIYLDQRWVSATGEFFAFFAIVTSFLGIGLGLFDFLADGLKWSREGWNRLWLTLLILVPSYVVAMTYSRAFLEALDASGGFGDAILNGIIPAAMVISGRYFKKQYSGPRIVWGGWVVLIAIMICALFVFGVEIAQRLEIFVPFQDARDAVVEI